MFYSSQFEMTYKRPLGIWPTKKYPRQIWCASTKCSFIVKCTGPWKNSYTKMVIFLLKRWRIYRTKNKDWFFAHIPPSMSMPLSTPSTSSPHCVVNNLDIAVVDDATSPLFARASPVRLSYSAVHANKRTASSTRAEDSISSPPKNRCDTRASLLSRRHGIVTAASYPTVLDIFGDDLVAATPRPSPPSVGVVLSAD